MTSLEAKKIPIMLKIDKIMNKLKRVAYIEADISTFLVDSGSVKEVDGDKVTCGD